MPLTGRFDERFRWIDNRPERELPDDTLAEIEAREELQEDAEDDE
jgi:hypothetical protein